MEDVALTISPVGVTLLVVACSNDWFFLVVELCIFFQGWLYFMTLVRNFILSFMLHSMWVDNFRFFLQVECLLGFAHHGTLSIEFEIFLVSAEKSFWIWVSDKLIGASCFPLGLVANPLKNIVRLYKSIEVSC